MKTVFIICVFICSTNFYLYSQEIDREIKVSQRTVDENYTVDKDSIVGKFIITNLTDKVIQVTGIDKACTCSTVTVSSNEIQPQKSITLVMSVAIKGDEFIDTYSVLVLSTGQRFYRFRVKGKLILT